MKKVLKQDQESGYRSLLNSQFKGRMSLRNRKPLEVTKMSSASRFLMSLFWLTFLYCDNLLAASSGGMPWEGPLTRLANSLTGPVARVAGVMAIAGAGLMLAMNQSEGFARTAIRIIFGLTIAFSATTWGLSFFGFGSGLVLP